MASTKKTVSAAHGVDMDFFLIHCKKRGHAKMVVFSNLQHIHAACALFGINVGIGLQCHPPPCSAVGVEDRGTCEKSEAIAASETFNVVVFGEEGWGIELAFDAETQRLRVHVGFQQIVGKNNLQPHLELRRDENLNIVANIEDRYPFNSSICVVIGGVKNLIEEINLGARSILIHAMNALITTE